MMENVFEPGSIKVCTCCYTIRQGIGISHNAISLRTSQYFVSISSKYLPVIGIPIVSNKIYMMYQSCNFVFCVTWSYLQVICRYGLIFKGSRPHFVCKFTHLKALPNHSCNRFVSIYIIHIIRYTYGTIPTCTIRVWGKDGEHNRTFTLGRSMCQVRHIWPTDYYVLAPRLI